MNRFFSLGEVSRILDVKYYKITYAHIVGHIPEPERLNNKRVYQKKDILNIARYFDIDEKTIINRLDEL